MEEELDRLINMFKKNTEAIKEQSEQKKKQADKIFKRTVWFLISSIGLIWMWLLTEVIANIIGWF